MLSKNHVLFGVSSYIFFEEIIATSPIISSSSSTGYDFLPFVFAGVGALFPDIDHPRSWVGQVFPFISKPISSIFGHRGITHSLVMIGSLLYLYHLYVDNSAYSSNLIIAFIVGYISHIIADFFTTAGVPLLWPLKQRFKIPLINFKTGSGYEFFVTYLFLISSILLMLNDKYPILDKFWSFFNLPKFY